MADLVGAPDRPAAGGLAAHGAVPLPRGAHAVVLGRRRDGALLLLRLPEGRRDRLREGDRGAGLPRDAWSCWPSATAWSSSARARIPQEETGAAGASGCSPCSTAPRASTPTTCGSRPRRPRRASTWPGAGCPRRCCGRFGSATRPRRGTGCSSGRASGRLHRRGAAGRRAGPARPRAAAISTASAGGSRSRWPTRAGACWASARARCGRSQRRKYLNTVGERALPQGPPAVRARPARERERQGGRVVVVEGYTDVLALHQAGHRGDRRRSWAPR